MPNAAAKTGKKRKARRRDSTGAGPTSCGHGKFGHHAGLEMRHVMAMQHPARGLAGVEGNRDHAHRRHIDGVAASPFDASAVDVHDLTWPCRCMGCPIIDVLWNMISTRSPVLATIGVCSPQTLPSIVQT